MSICLLSKHPFGCKCDFCAIEWTRQSNVRTNEYKNETKTNDRLKSKSILETVDLFWMIWFVFGACVRILSSQTTCEFCLAITITFTHSHAHTQTLFIPFHSVSWKYFRIVQIWKWEKLHIFRLLIRIIILCRLFGLPAYNSRKH